MTIGQDSGQHRKRGDRHRDPQEDAEVQRNDVRGRQMRIKRYRDQDSQHKGGDDAGLGDRDRPTALPAEQGRVDFEPHQEHVQDHAQARDRAQKGYHRRGKQIGERARCDPAEQRRTQRDSGDDLAHDQRLAQAAEGQPQNARHHDYDGQSEQLMQQLIAAHRPRSKIKARRGRVDSNRAGRRTDKKQTQGWPGNHLNADGTAFTANLYLTRTPPSRGASLHHLSTTWSRSIKRRRGLAARIYRG